jgi:hypothetical protein
MEPTQSEKAARLPHPLRLAEQVLPEGTVPMVTIWCITYNHVNFIRDAIEGFLMQETTFPVEILIHDDASTDGTAEIVREYQAAYPHLIRAVLQTENQWSKGIKPAQLLNKMVRGKFVALCEGDDYWTSPLKLQKQVEVLEADSCVVGVFHAVDMTDVSGVFLGRLPLEEGERHLAFQDIVAVNDRATCSILYRHEVPGPDLSWAKDLPMRDWPLQATLAAKGPWRLLPEVMAVYRRHEGGVWSCLDGDGVMKGTLMFYNAASKKFGQRFLKAIGHERKKLQAALLHIAVQDQCWADARRYLAQYVLSSPKRLSIPRGQKKNVIRTLVSVFRSHG